MAQRVKSWLPRSAGQAAAVFILLSATGECLQCYWCGPRAEQVHRSERAPPCGAEPRELTACDPGYTHCAIVATSPPFVESRHCVKLYQDECYPQYCNSTKSFRMTCPCRGDLCNGPNTERENEAFAALAEIVANARIKRNAITSSSFVIAGKGKMNNLIENEVEENADSNDTNNETLQVTQNIPTEQPASVENEVEVTTTPEMQKDLIDTVVSTTVAAKEMPVAIETIAPAESLKVDVTTTQAPETSMQPAENMKVEVNEPVKNEIMPGIQHPTAEALQQNASPIVATEKSMEQTTVETTTENDKGTAMPLPTKPKNSSAVAYLNIFFILLNVLAFNFIM